MISMRGKKIALGVLVGALALALYLPSIRHGFISYDDPVYITENPHVLGGLTVEGLRWSVSAAEGGNWHPLTWWSHQLAIELFGTWAGGHHLLNALLHAGAAGGLFLVISGLTGTLLPGLAVASLFACHPLHVESVAWVSERKDVLVAFFWMLTLEAWTAYVRSPSPRRYILASGFFGLALMAKPMAVVLPLVLLALDFWPLGRLRPGPGRIVGVLFLEKLPLLLAAAGLGVLTLSTQHEAGALRWLSEMPPDLRSTLALMRVSNAVVSYSAYLGKAVWPAGLAVFYRHPAHEIAGLTVALSGTLLAGVTSSAYFLRRRAPWVATGWAWYLLTLAPVIGVIQSGAQARADRYAYLPLIGVWIAVAWSVRALVSQRSRLRLPAAVFTLAVIVAFAALTVRQLGYWQSTETLFTHAVEVTRDNYVAHRVLGEEARRQGRPAEAERHFRAVIALAPRSSGAHFRLGLALFDQGRLAEAAEEYREATRLEPRNVDARNNLGVTLTALGELVEGDGHLRAALRLAPAVAEIWANLGDNLAGQGRIEEAADAYRRALEIKPGLAEVRARLHRLLPAGDPPR